MIERNLNLPKKDKNGKSRLSFSQIKCFKENKEDFINRYILNQPFVSNEYIDFGSKVGEALENDNFNNFHELEEEILRKVERLDEFEKFEQNVCVFKFLQDEFISIKEIVSRPI